MVCFQTLSRYAISAIANWKMLGDISAGNSRTASLDLQRPVGGGPIPSNSGLTTAGGHVNGLLHATGSQAPGDSGAVANVLESGGGGPKLVGSAVRHTTLLDPTALRLALQNAAAVATASAKKQMASISHNTGIMAGAFGAGLGGFFGSGKAMGSAVESELLEASSDLVSELGANSSNLQRQHLVSPQINDGISLDHGSSEFLIPRSSSPRPGGSSINCMTQLQVEHEG